MEYVDACRWALLYRREVAPPVWFHSPEYYIVITEEDIIPPELKFLCPS
jgi:hypothetical protein